MLQSIINVESLKASCWLKYVHVKNLSKKSEYSEMWREKKIKTCFHITEGMKKKLVITLSDHGMATYGHTAVNLD